MQSGPRPGGVSLLASDSFWAFQAPEAGPPHLSAPGRVVRDGYGVEYQAPYGEEYYSYESVSKIGKFETHLKWPFPNRPKLLLKNVDYRLFSRIKLTAM